MSHLLQEFLTAPWLYIISLTLLGFWIALRATRAALCLWILAALMILQNSAWTFSWLSTPLIAASNSLSLNTGCLDDYPVLVILGGGLASKDRLSDASAERVGKAIEFLRDKPKTVIVSGGPTLEADRSVTEAGLGERDLRLALGPVNKIPIWREEQSLTTYQNATRSRAMADAHELGRKVILVTSVYHMPRAAAVFTTQGFTVCALPSYPPALGLARWLSYSNAAPIAMLIHEYIGYWYYKWRGWI